MKILFWTPAVLNKSWFFVNIRLEGELEREKHTLWEVRYFRPISYICHCEQPINQGIESPFKEFKIYSILKREGGGRRGGFKSWKRLNCYSLDTFFWCCSVTSNLKFPNWNYTIGQLVYDHHLAYNYKSNRIFWPIQTWW